MPDEHLTQQHLGHVITSDKRWYKVCKETGEVLHEVQDQCCAALTNLQRGMRWLENHLGVHEEEDDDGVTIDIDQSVAILQA